MWYISIKSLIPGSLSIKDSQETDQGDYECVAENSKGTEYSYEAKLYVRGMLYFADKRHLPFKNYGV